MMDFANQIEVRVVLCGNHLLHRNGCRGPFSAGTHELVERAEKAMLHGRGRNRLGELLDRRR